MNRDIVVEYSRNARVIVQFIKVERPLIVVLLVTKQYDNPFFIYEAISPNGHMVLIVRFLLSNVKEDHFLEN